MKKVIRYFLKFVSALGWMLLYGIGLILGAFFIGLVIVLLALDPNSLVSPILMIGLTSVPAIIFLVVIDRIRLKVAATLYFRSLPKVDAQTFRQAFPEYDEGFLFEVRRVMATHLRIASDKISSELYLGQGAVLDYLTPSLYTSLFKHFRPAAIPPIEMVTVRTAAIRPRPAHLVDFPAAEVSSLHDLLREIHHLKCLDITLPRHGAD